MTLPPEQSTEFFELVHQERDYVEVGNMVSIYEQVGMRIGIKMGKRHVVLLLLEKRFGKLTPATLRKVQRVETNERLDELLVAILDAKSLADLSF